MTTNNNDQATAASTTAPLKSARGFAVMDPDRRRELASKGGKSAHARGLAHEWNHEEAVLAGTKGGRSSQQRRAASKA